MQSGEREEDGLEVVSEGGGTRQAYKTGFV